MSGSKKTAEWRKFEELVTLIERHLGPKGAVVRSPDHIPDRTTGERREVDASVRYNVGSIPILITVECRRRLVKQDVRWIEQIVQKRDDIGASASVAVSATEFSEPALAKARFYGIETRLLRDVKGQAIRDWAQTTELIVVKGSFGLGRLQVRFKQASSGPGPMLHPVVKAEYEKGDAEYKFIRQIKDGSLISLADLMRQSEQEAGNVPYDNTGCDFTLHLPPKTSGVVPLSDPFPSLFNDVPIGGDPVTKVFAWDFDSDEATIETDRGPVVIEHLAVEIHVVHRAFPSNVGRLLAYESDSGPIVNVEERQVQISEGESIQVVVCGTPEVQKSGP